MRKAQRRRSNPRLIDASRREIVHARSIMREVGAAGACLSTA
jgi:hypothetical protein